jgi:hypothetical protein
VVKSGVVAAFLFFIRLKHSKNITTANMKYLILICFALQILSVNSQSKCTAVESFDSLHLFLKENYAGYADKINTANAKQFELFTTKYRDMISNAKKPSHSYLLITSWLRFFKDEHLSMSVRVDTANGKLASAIASAEKIPVQKIPVTQLEGTSASSIEGIYYSMDSSYKIAVVKSDDHFRKYAGIILKAKAAEWQPGMVKFEMVPAEGSGKFDMIWYDRYHSPIFSQLDFGQTNTFHTEGWYKSNFRKEQVVSNSQVPLFEEERSHNTFFKQLDEQTSYLRISSFEANHIQEIDSVIKANTVLLEKLPYLIIDVRNNGGGLDISYRPLKRLMYTDPVKSIGVDLLATPYNIDITLQLINSVAELPDAEKKEYSDLMDKARKSNQRMFDFFPDTVQTSSSIPYPQKIAIIINERCGSTTEQFLFEAKQSRKVTLFGTHTTGVLDYANVRDKIFCSRLTAHYPTTRSRRIDIGQGIDNVGILPDVELDFTKEGWLKRVQQTISR